MKRERAEEVCVEVNGTRIKVPRGVTVARALEISGYRFSEPHSKELSLACGTGGCWNCSVLVDGSLERACVTPVKEGMRISTEIEGVEPLRI
ncbi:MAG: (2Fe-2S)-binding protein, partial [Candidatus Korarchaeum sp.]|nr:(2Fe-2S)-binding protein [Candidatus Korarchaeum sp.]